VFGTFGPEAAVVPVSGDVQALTGRPAQTFAQWVERNREAFASGQAEDGREERR
jgi:hypothetical protein